MSSTNPFDKYIVNSILCNNEFGIKKIRLLETIVDLSFDRKSYPEIVQLVKNGDIEKIVSMKADMAKFSECLGVMKCFDQTNRLFIVTTYDNDLLSQDPQVIDIFPYPYTS